MLILVFKTNITQSDDSTLISSILNSIPGIHWNFDHWDEDHILRVESEHDCSANIISRLNQSGFSIHPLED